MTVPLIGAHPGRHCREREPRASLLPEIFRRAMRTVRRKLAALEVPPFASRAAAPTTLLARPVNGRSLGTLPRLTAPGSPPWPVADFRDVLAEQADDRETSAATGSFPALPTLPEMRAEYGVDRCQLDVDEAQRLADRVIA